MQIGYSKGMLRSSPGRESAMTDDQQLEIWFTPRERYQLDYWRTQIGATLDGLELRWLAQARPVWRLRRIGFLGALTGGPSESKSDNRYDHTLGAAYLAGLMATRCKLPPDVIRHLVAAVMLHDTGNRALSHTCEAAFDEISSTNGKELTEAIITGLPTGLVPSSHVLKADLIERGLNLDFLLQIFRKDRNQSDPDKRIAVELYSNPINPDTLDGILRAAHLLLAQYLNPVDVAKAFQRVGDRAVVSSDAISLLDGFWEKKDDTYQAHIHNEKALKLERHFTKATLALYSGYTSIQIFRLSDRRVRQDVARLSQDSAFPQAVVRDRPMDLFGSETLRFRKPRKYLVAESIPEGDKVDIGFLEQRYRSVRMESE